MEGVRKRIEADAEAALRSAYQGGAFAGLAYHGKLRPFPYYDRKVEDAQNPRDMLGMIKSMGAGSNMKVRRVKLDRKPEA